MRGRMGKFFRIYPPVTSNSDKPKEFYREGAKILVFRAAASI
jgi:hypothetical protein